jgi:hypothetical protein
MTDYLMKADPGSFEWKGYPPTIIVHGREPTSGDTGDRRSEAQELVVLYSPLADREQVSRASAQICNTRAAAETRELPEQIFLFEREGRGAWGYVGEADKPPSRPAI